jgi:heat shock protein HslJ
MPTTSMTRGLRPLLWLVAALTLAACATAAQQPTVPPADVRWTLTHLEGAPVASSTGGREPGLQFAAEGRVTGFTTCNNFFGRYDAPGAGRLRLADLGSTKMACVDPALGRQEQRFMAALQRVDRFAVDGERLVLREGDRELARFAAAR